MKITDYIQKLLMENYDLGNVTAVWKIKAGDTNNSFFAVCDKDGEEKAWYVRQYNPAEEERDIIYEHAFEEYLNRRIDQNMQTLRPVVSKSGSTWVIGEYEGQSNFYAVFHTISGREPYSWEYNNLSDLALDSCVEITAKFHAWAYGFEGPKGSGRQEPSLGEQFKNWKQDLPHAITKMQGNKKVFQRFTDYLETEQDFLMETIDYCDAELKKYENSLKKCVCHKDLNPGNLMFDENDKVCAVFDLDWVNTDYRLYDIAWMAYLAMASWDTRSWGVVPMDKMGRFIHIYNETMLKYDSPLGILTTEEQRFLPNMMIIVAMKIIMDFCCYEDHTDDVHRVFVNTWRFVSSVHYMLDHLDDMLAEI